MSPTNIKNAERRVVFGTFGSLVRTAPKWCDTALGCVKIKREGQE